MQVQCKSHFFRLEKNAVKDCLTIDNKLLIFHILAGCELELTTPAGSYDERLSEANSATFTMSVNYAFVNKMCYI